MADSLTRPKTQMEDRSWWWKSCQRLKVGDHVDLIVASGEDADDPFSGPLHPAEDRSSTRYAAWVEDIDEEKIVLGLRFEHAVELELQTGQSLIFKRPHEDGMWIYEGVVSADRAIKLEISRPLKATRIQRREYCRVAVEKETTFAKSDDPDSDCRGLAHDLSGGGVSIAVNDEASVGDRLQIDVPLGDETVQMEGVVRRIAAEKRAGYEYLLGVEFVDPLRFEQDRIVGFVFTRQRKMRKKRVE